MLVVRTGGVEAAVGLAVQRHGNLPLVRVVARHHERAHAHSTSSEREENGPDHCDCVRDTATSGALGECAATEDGCAFTESS